MSSPRARPPRASRRPPRSPRTGARGRPPLSPHSRIFRRRLVALGLLGLIVLIAVRSIAGGGVQAPPAPGLAGPGAGGPGVAFRYLPSREAAYAARATAGSAQVLYTMSPGGALATAARVAPFRKLIDAAVRGTPIPARLLEALVFLESAGRPQVIAGSSAADAAGLTQILAGTGQQLLGMRIDLARSERLTGEIERATALGQAARVSALERHRAAIDQRFVPRAALAATVRYLQIALHDFGGRLDLAVAAYHAGIGNLQQVLGDYGAGRPVPYAQLYFDSSPVSHAAAYDLLYSLSDDSSLYWWRVLGAEQIMSLYRTDRAALNRIAALQTAYPSNAEVLVPPGSTASFAGPQGVSDAYVSRALVPLPRNASALHLAYASSMGEDARKLSAPVGLYRGLRPAALTTLLAIAAEVHAIAPGSAPLTVTQTVVDRSYLQLLGEVDPPATTGYTFQIERRYSSPAQAAAFQFVLDRLQALDVIAWTRLPATIEITVAPDAAAVLEHGP